MLYARLYASRYDNADFSLKLSAKSMSELKVQQRIKVVEARLNELISEAIREGTCSARVVRDMFIKDMDASNISMQDLFIRWIENQKRRVAWKEIRPVTLKRHLATQVHLENFLAKPGQNVMISTLGVEWLRRLEA